MQLKDGPSRQQWLSGDKLEDIAGWEKGGEAEQILKDHLYSKDKEEAWRRDVQIEFLKEMPRQTIKEGHDKMQFDFDSDNIDYGTNSESEDIESSGE